MHNFQAEKSTSRTRVEERQSLGNRKVLGKSSAGRNWTGMMSDFTDGQS